MKYLKRLGWVLLCLLLLVLVLIAYLTMTHGGMKRLFSLGQSYSQGELSWGESSGSLKGPASLNDIVYVSDAGASVKVAKGYFDWKPKKLWSRTIEVNDFSLSGVEIMLPPPSQQPAEKRQPFQLRDLALPFDTNIEQVSISDVKVYPHGVDTPIVIDKIELVADGRGDTMKLVKLRVSAPQGELRLGGSISARGVWPLDLHQQWRFNHPVLGEFTGQGSMTGNVNNMHVQHVVDGAVDINVDAMVKDVVAEVSWDGEVNAQSDDLGGFSDALAGVPLSVAANTNGSLQQYGLNGKINTSHSQTGPLSLDLQLSGTLDEVVIEQGIINLEQSPAVANITGNLTLADLQSNIAVEWSELQWPLLNAQGLEEGEALVAVSPSGKAVFNGTADDYAVKVEANLGSGLVEQAGLFDLAVAMDGNTQLINIETVSLESESSDTDLTINGTVDLQSSTVDVNGKWQSLGWPLQLAEGQNSDQKIINSEAGQFSVVGPLDGYKINAQLSVEGQNVPAGQWQLSGNGSQQAIDDINLQGQTLDGVVTGNGRVNFSPAMDWVFDLVAKNINPAGKWPDSRGQINLEINTVGAVGDNGTQAKATIANLSGHYRDQPLSGTGEVRVAGEVVEIDRLSVKAGPALLTANGKLSDALDLQWRLNAPELDKLAKGLSGAVELKGDVAGTMIDPASDFSIDVSNFNSGDVQVESITGAGTIDLSGGEKSNIKLSVNNITRGDQVWDQLQLNGSGVPAKHQLEVSLQGALADLTINVDGGVSDETWSGTIDQLDLEKSPIGDWALERPVSVKASASQVVADKFCIASEPSSVCVDGQWSAAGGVKAEIDIPKLHAKHFGEYLPPDLDIDAAVTGRASVKTDADGKPTVVADLKIPGGEINYLDNGEQVNNPLGQSRLQFELSNDNIKSDLDLDLGEIGTARGVATVAGLSTTKTLGGSIKTDIKDLSIASVFAPDMQSVDGEFNTDVQLGGTLDAPAVVGDTGLGGLVAEIPFIGMKVFDGAMNATSDGKGGLNIDGSVTSGDGELKFTGLYNPGTGDMDIAVKGENFQLANTSRQRATVDPDLLIRVNGENMTVTGTVHIPSAYIESGGEDAVIRESSDVVIVNGGEDLQESQETKVKLDVKVTLGDDIRVKAGPFDGALGGGLTIEQQPGRVPTGSGAIEVLSGDFLVYGQKLTMEQGRVLFGGGPIDNPALEIDVARDVTAYDVKAGAQVRGTAQAPLLQLQSEPAQTDANTLSYILLGRPVDGTGVSYTLGKFITPDIYVSYGIDLFEKIQTYNLRYKITDKLSFVATKSATSSADLIYTFER